MLDNLNENQRQAVTLVDGPVLVLAGAGTGKTTVITARIAHIVSSGLATMDEILAVTFTNKAAQEMKDRIEKLVGYHGGSFSSWMGTFHSICLKILKMYVQFCGLKPGFTIADSYDQKQFVKKALEYLEISEKSVPTKLVSYAISGMKNEGIDCYSHAEVSRYNQGDMDMTKIYPKYQELLRQSNMVDFDDLLLLVTNLFRSNPEILEYFQKKFKYVLVDEYQDTNKTQYNLVSMLVAKSQNICCVGDDDQSIYSWRGADIANILNFQRYFKDSKIVTLSDNYRSTQSILDFANDLISANSKRYEKKLQSNLQDFRSVKVVQVYDDRQESEEIVRIIKNLMQDGTVNYRKDVAVLVRTSAQMRSIEEAFIKWQMPYRIVGGVKFYERKEIKDAISYIKLLISDSDVLSLERVINVPKRGIGEKTLDSISSFADGNGLPIMHAIKVMIEQSLLNQKISESLAKMFDVIQKARIDLASGKTSLVHVCSFLLEEIGYMDMLREEMKSDPSYEKKIDNVEELMTNISRFATLQEFFEHISLISDIDQLDESDLINVMTIHAAKGLEFDAVLLPGWEDDLFPNKRVLDESGRQGIEEERRLAYVAVTRAKRALYILSASLRFMHGRYNTCDKSPFITSVSSDLYELINKTGKHGISLEKNATSQGYRRSFSHSGDSQSQRRATSASGFTSSLQNEYLKKLKKPSLGNEVGSQSANKLLGDSGNITTGSKVSHSKYGHGEIIRQIGKFVEVKFSSGQRMVLDVAFLRILN